MTKLSVTTVSAHLKYKFTQTPNSKETTVARTGDWGEHIQFRKGNSPVATLLLMLELHRGPIEHPSTWASQL